MPDNTPLCTTAAPRERSVIRMYLGRIFFTGRRYFTWFFTKNCYNAFKQDIPLPYSVFKHSTPLLRQLRNVDMHLQRNKVNNLRLAVGRIDGVILRPGEIFSFWRTVGKPTRRKGYLEGMVLHNGTIRPETGGGLCQLSNLIYWMTLHTPLTVTERWRHNYDVFPDCDRTQPFGSGATVAYNYIDLQIRNDTEDSYQLLVGVEENDLIGEWRSDRPARYGYLVYERLHSITHEWWGGYVRHNMLRRKIISPDNIELSDQPVAENHAVMMYEPLLPEGVT